MCLYFIHLTLPIHVLPLIHGTLHHIASHHTTSYHSTLPCPYLSTFPSLPYLPSFSMSLQVVPLYDSVNTNKVKPAKPNPKETGSLRKPAFCPLVFGFGRFHCTFSQSPAAQGILVVCTSLAHFSENTRFKRYTRRRAIIKSKSNPELARRFDDRVTFDISCFEIQFVRDLNSQHC